MRKIILPLLLIILTLLVILIPPFLSGQNQRNIADKTTYRDYNAGYRSKITSEQVAKLYCDQEISMTYNYLPVNTQNKEQIHENIIDLIEMLFESDQQVCAPIEKILLSSDNNYIDNATLNNYSRSNILIKVDNQPTSLNFVHYYIENENGYLVIRYEEKTKTIIGFSCNAKNVSFKNINNAFDFSKKISQGINNHYENYANIDKYYVDLYVPKKTQDSLSSSSGGVNKDENDVNTSLENAGIVEGESAYSTTVHISFGLN